MRHLQFAGWTALGLVPACGGPPSGDDVPHIQIPAVRPVRLSAKTSMDAAEELTRDPFQFEESVREGKPEHTFHNSYGNATGPNGTPATQPAPSPWYRIQSGVSLVKDGAPAFRFENKLYRVGDVFLREWVVDRVTADHASLHWVSDRHTYASIKLKDADSELIMFETRK